jgi:hypothetical protein
MLFLPTEQPLYRSNQSQEIVANCHKVPQKNLVRSYFRFKQFMIALPTVQLIRSILMQNSFYGFSCASH